MKTTGNYINQQYRNFPLDAEGLLAIQQNIAAVELIGRLAGDKAIISGCKLNDAGNHREAGWVWLKTVSHPLGELLPWSGGSALTEMYVKSTPIEVQADGYDYPQAYTERSLAPGTGEEKYAWGDFHVAESTDELRKVIDAQAIAIAKIKPEPVGVVKMYAGQKAPDKCMFCDGKELQKSEYPELFVAIGSAFNNAQSYAGVPYTTADGCFRLPDLRGRFIVGHNAGDADYNKNGLAGGIKTVRLSEAQIPAHNHASGSKFNKFAAKATDVAGSSSVAVTDVDNSGYEYAVSAMMTQQMWDDATIKSVGKGEAHENRPPWYALAYIITVK